MQSLGRKRFHPSADGITREAACKYWPPSSGMVLSPVFRNYFVAEAARRSKRTKKLKRPTANPATLGVYPAHNIGRLNGNSSSVPETIPMRPPPLDL